MPKLILSAVGTSLFTNIANGNRSVLNKYSNKQDTDIPDELRNLLQIYEGKLRPIFEENDTATLKMASAEFNSLLTLYDHGFQGNNQDIHLLITTDTYLGSRASTLIQSYLNKYFDTVMVYVPPQLSTRNKEAFQTGIKNLMRWCDDTGYKSSGYEIIFNLTGGFKSLQGYLNTIGMFYADRIIYIFEQSNELITIPRLPIKIETGIFENHAAVFLALSETNEGIPLSQLANIPEIMTEHYQNEKYVLSDWGELSWNNVKEEILGRALVELPFIAYTSTFIRDFQNIDRLFEKVKLQELIAKISCILKENDGDISSLKGGRAGGILYDNYSGRNSALGHFRVNRGSRISCEDVNGRLELRHYGQHDYVNDNP